MGEPEQDLLSHGTPIKTNVHETDSALKEISTNLQNLSQDQP